MNTECPIWREEEIRKRLNLTLPIKAKIALNAAKLFEGGLDRLGDWQTEMGPFL